MHRDPSSDSCLEPDHIFDGNHRFSVDARNRLLPWRKPLREWGRSRSVFLMHRDPVEALYRVRTTGPQGSGILSSLSQANGLIVVPEDRDSLEEGETVRVQLLPWFGASVPNSDLR